MTINIDFVLSQTDGRPMYLQIMELIKQRVAIGDWPADAKLPSIRELAVSLSVSVITIKRAYLELEREGVIVTRHGKGSFVASGSEVGEQLYRDKLDEHLREALKLARLLAMDEHELQERLAEMQQQITKEST